MTLMIKSVVGPFSFGGAVFTHPGNCYRSGVSYNAALKRYLWSQTLPASKDSRGPRFQGGLGVYDAPEPGNRSRDGLADVRHWQQGQGRVLRQDAQPDRSRRRQSEDDDRFPLRLRDDAQGVDGCGWVTTTR